MLGWGPFFGDRRGMDGGTEACLMLVRATRGSTPGRACNPRTRSGTTGRATLPLAVCRDKQVMADFAMRIYWIESVPLNQSQSFALRANLMIIHAIL